MEELVGMAEGLFRGMSRRFVGWASARSAMPTPYSPNAPGRSRTSPPQSRWKCTTRHEAMKAAVRPVANTRHQLMLHRIEMNVVHVALKYLYRHEWHAPNIDCLPNSLVPLRNFARGTRPCGGQATREACLYQAPARRKVSIAFWKRPHSVNVVRQNANGDCFKRAASLPGNAYASRNRSICLTSALLDRSAKTTVKKNVPPLIVARL